MNNGYRPPNRDRRNRMSSPTPEERARHEAYMKKRREMETARRQAEIDRIRREKRLAEERKKKMRQKNAKIFAGRFVFFLVILLMLLLIAGGIFIFVFKRTPHKTPDSGTVTYYFGGEKKREAPVSKCLSGNILYICFNDISDYVGMAESGSADQMKFILPSAKIPPTSAGDGNEDYVTFLTDGNTVIINDQNVSLDIPNKLDGSEVWVSSSFIENYMNGLSVDISKNNTEVRISKIKDNENSTDKNTIYLNVSLKLKPPDIISPLPEDTDIGEITDTGNSGDSIDPADLGFVNDLSDYEKYMNPESDRDAYLILVNTTHTLTESDVPNDLMDVKYTSTARKTQQLRKNAAMALEALYMEMHSVGYYDMAVYSGFRTYTYQNTLFENYTANEMARDPSLTREEAEAIVLTYSTRPGTSEHQTGLAVDMDTLGTFTTDFEYTAEYEWLTENAWKFGFILRFPKDKTDITSIQFEPWHYRYVGRYHAKKIHDSGLCLEEYVENLAQN